MWETLLDEVQKIVAGGYERTDYYLRNTNNFAALIFSEKAFAIAPAARLARKAVHKMAANGATMPVALCDQNKALWGTTVSGVPVMSYKDFAARWPSAALWIASAMYDSDITMSAVTSGIRQTVPYPHLAHNLPELFITREYDGLTKSVFEDGAMEGIQKLCTILADNRSREVLLSKVLFYLTYDKALLDSIKSQERIYWDPTIVGLLQEEIVVDGGAFRGDTLEDFLEASRNACYRYYAFEPDPLIFDKLRNVCGTDESRLICIQSGLSDRQDRVAFSISGTLDTRIVSQGYEVSDDVAYLDVTDLDSFFRGKTPPTFIKMDIEGEERRALSGARSLIETHRPTLAVSAYHYPQDLWEIPLMIADLNPRARIFLRHYTREVDDTVCYSIPQGR